MLTDNRVEVAGQEGSLEASMQSINDDSERDQEAGGVNAHPGEGIDDSRASEQEHGCDDDVGEEAEAEEHDVRCRAPSRPDDLADGVRCRRFPLDFNGQHSEEQHLHQTHTHTLNKLTRRHSTHNAESSINNSCSKGTKLEYSIAYRLRVVSYLNGGATGVPEGTAHSILPSHIRTLQDRRSPCPLHTTTNTHPHKSIICCTAMNQPHRNKFIFMRLTITKPCITKPQNSHATIILISPPASIFLLCPSNTKSEFLEMKMWNT